MNARTQAQIQIEITSSVRTKIPTTKLLKAARTALVDHFKSAEVSLALVGDCRMSRLHESTMGISGPTDVLAFHHGDTPEGTWIEVVVCVPVAKRHSVRHDVPFEQELVRYVVHGCLHCAGFDDHDAEDRSAMWTVQESIVADLFGRKYKSP